MRNSEPFVIYIIGDNRSGTTLLDYLLSHHPEAYSVGEMHHLHSYYNKNKGMGILYNWECSCGNTVENCDFWSEILQKLPFSETFYTRLYPNRMDKMKRLIHILNKIILTDYVANEDTIEKGRKFAERIWKLYNEIFKFTGYPIIIDSSKSALEAYFLYRYRKGNIKFIHLERDICAVANSKFNHTRDIPNEIKKYWHPKEKSLYSLLISSYRRRKENRLISRRIQKLAGEVIVKRINYLELTENPEDTISDICDFMMIEPYPIPLITGEYTSVPHVLCGSPSRYKKRPIKPDNRWRSNFKKKPLALLIGRFLQNI